MLINSKTNSHGNPGTKSTVDKTLTADQLVVVDLDRSPAAPCQTMVQADCTKRAATRDTRIAQARNRNRRSTRTVPFMAAALTAVACLSEPAKAQQFTVCDQDSWFFGFHSDFDYNFKKIAVDPHRSKVAVGAKKLSSDAALISLLSYSNTDSTAMAEEFAFEITGSEFDSTWAVGSVASV